ncbi:cell division protein FtsP, partial [Escherichia coli]
EAALNLPSGVYEIPLVIQDKRLTTSSITYDPTTMEVMTGYMGETVIVNGKGSPYTEVASRYYRLRILNGSNARIYNLALSNNADLIIIGND